MHHSASAIYKIDDQGLCRSGRNDAADMHRGTLTDNRRQGVDGQAGEEAVLDEKKTEKQSGRMETDGRAKQDKYTLRNKGSN